MKPAFAADLEQTLAALGPVFAERAARYDDTDDFVAENYADIQIGEALFGTCAEGTRWWWPSL